MEEIVANDVIVNETWRSIDGYINYQVSNIGRVRNANTGRMLKPLLMNSGYFRVSLCNNNGVRSFLIHKLVAQEFLEPPDDNTIYCVDHINRERIDNQVTNLRYVTPQQNQMNKSKEKKRQTSSVFKGVTKKGNNWTAQIKFNKQYIHLGSFSDEDEAARAYDLKAQELFGEYAALNFPAE